MSFEFISNATQNKLKNREPWLAQKNNHNIIDVSLCAGQMIIPGSDDKHFFPLAERLHLFNKELSRLFPYITFYGVDYLHSTLLTLFNDSETAFTNARFEIKKLCQKTLAHFIRYQPINIALQDVLLTPNGSIILMGKSQELLDFRQEIYSTYNFPDCLKKDIIHITLGRLLQNETVENMEAINNYLTIQGTLHLPSVTVNSPKIIISRDTHCFNIDTELTLDFNSAIESVSF
ncbi:hypothetical protein J2X14_000019 [Pantoea alhagi]|uniref:hypothetical protein n=1 Tax=Mixta sp. BE291 TaxID=3158787 RepID=UPI0028563F73|nr:hypothetical protein [Pantoea alhagi]